MTKKNRPPYNAVSAARTGMRRVFSRSPIVIAIIKKNSRKVPRYRKDGTRHKIDGAEYFCNSCREWVKGPVAVDHIEPVVDPVVGFVDFNTYFERLFCDESNLNLLCSMCHNDKTQLEWKQRRLKTAWDELDAFVASLNQDPSDKNRLGVHKALKKFTPKRLSNMTEDLDFLMKLSALRESVQPPPKSKAAKQRKKKAKPA